jgi:hypothetical protein
VAYSSVSHLGFVMLGVFAATPVALQGGVLQMINHGISTGALFLIVGIIYERRHTRMITEYGGLSHIMPVYATVFLIMTLSSIGMPGLNGFIGEFFILQGTFAAKAGFNLREPFTIRIRQDSRDVTASLPKPRLLSLEMTGYKVLEDDNGWWNAISSSDRESAVMRLTETARKQALSSGLLADAQRTATARITEILERNGATAAFIQRSEGVDAE